VKKRIGQIKLYLRGGKIATTTTRKEREKGETIFRDSLCRRMPVPPLLPAERRNSYYTHSIHTIPPSWFMGYLVISMLLAFCFSLFFVCGGLFCFTTTTSFSLSQYVVLFWCAITLRIF
jgi:hypothetical protein